MRMWIITASGVVAKQKLPSRRPVRFVRVSSQPAVCVRVCVCAKCGFSPSLQLSLGDLMSDICCGDDGQVQWRRLAHLSQLLLF